MGATQRECEGTLSRSRSGPGLKGPLARGARPRHHNGRASSIVPSWAASPPELRPFATVHIHPFEIGQMELPDGPLFNHTQPPFPLRAVAERLGHHQGIDAGELLHVALDGFDALDLE